MKKHQGFTLIELVMFIVITSILASGILLSFVTLMSKTPVVLQNMIASQTAKQCAEWFLGQRRLNGFDTLTCNGVVPAFCTAPSGYTITSTCATTSIGGDSNYDIVTIAVSGPGNAGVSLLLADY